MDQRVEVRGRMGELPVLERVVQGRLLVVRPLHERQRRAVRDGNRYIIFLALVSAKPTWSVTLSCDQLSLEGGLVIYIYACIYY